MRLPRRHYEVALVPEETERVGPLSRCIDALSTTSTHSSLRFNGNAGPLVWALQELGWRWVDLSMAYLFRARPEVLTNPWRFTPPRPAERDRLALELARVLTDARLIRTRFTTDARLRGLALPFYREWSRRALRSGNGRVTWVARDDRDRPLGVLCAVLDRASCHAVIQLNGVFPRERSQGVYTSLLAHAVREMFANGMNEVHIRTSGSTTSVQRVWQRLGGIPVATHIVMHKTVREFSRDK